MPYLIDGNNVIGQMPGWHLEKPESRKRLLGHLGRFVSATGSRVTVVFDGAPDPDVPDGTVYHKVRVYYPGRGSDADTLIERLVERSTDRRKLIVVTSDRQLATRCRSAGARTLRSGDFRKFMGKIAREVVPEPDPGEREDAAPVPGSVEDWLRYFGYDASKAAERERAQPSPPAPVRKNTSAPSPKSAPPAPAARKTPPEKKRKRRVEPRKRKLGPAFEEYFLRRSGEGKEEAASSSLEDWARYLGLSASDLEARSSEKPPKRSRKRT